MLNRRHFLAGCAAIPFAATPATAMPSCVFQPQTLAVHGMDPVSYFSAGGPVSGTAQYRLGWRHAIWQFASSSAMHTFERNPNRYAPRYGGYCAVTMAGGGVSETVPEAWAVHDGRLYFARSSASMAAWRDDPAAYIAQADQHWAASRCA